MVTKRRNIDVTKQHGTMSGGFYSVFDILTPDVLLLGSIAFFSAVPIPGVRDPISLFSYLQHYIANYSMAARIKQFLNGIVKTIMHMYPESCILNETRALHCILMILLNNPSMIDGQVGEDLQLNIENLSEGLNHQDVFINTQFYELTGYHLPPTFKRVFNLSPFFAWDLSLFRLLGVLCFIGYEHQEDMLQLELACRAKKTDAEKITELKTILESTNSKKTNVRSLLNKIKSIEKEKAKGLKYVLNIEQCKPESDSKKDGDPVKNEEKSNSVKNSVKTFNFHDEFNDLFSTVTSKLFNIRIDWLFQNFLPYEEDLSVVSDVIKVVGWSYEIVRPWNFWDWFDAIDTCAIFLRMKSRKETIFDFYRKIYDSCTVWTSLLNRVIKQECATNNKLFLYEKMLLLVNSLQRFLKPLVITSNLKFCWNLTSTDYQKKINDADNYFKSKKVIHKFTSDLFDDMIKNAKDNIKNFPIGEIKIYETQEKGPIGKMDKTPKKNSNIYENEEFHKYVNGIKNDIEEFKKNSEHALIFAKKYESAQKTQLQIFLKTYTYLTESIDSFLFHYTNIAKSYKLDEEKQVYKEIHHLLRALAIFFFENYPSIFKGKEKISKFIINVRGGAVTIGTVGKKIKNDAANVTKRVSNTTKSAYDKTTTKISSTVKSTAKVVKTSVYGIGNFAEKAAKNAVKKSIKNVKQSYNFVLGKRTYLKRRQIKKCLNMSSINLDDLEALLKQIKLVNKNKIPPETVIKINKNKSINKNSFLEVFEIKNLKKLDETRVQIFYDYLDNSIDRLFNMISHWVMNRQIKSLDEYYDLPDIDQLFSDVDDDIDLDETFKFHKDNIIKQFELLIENKIEDYQYNCIHSLILKYLDAKQNEKPDPIQNVDTQYIKYEISDFSSKKYNYKKIKGYVIYELNHSAKSISLNEKVKFINRIKYNFKNIEEEILSVIKKYYDTKFSSQINLIPFIIKTKKQFRSRGDINALDLKKGESSHARALEKILFSDETLNVGFFIEEKTSTKQNGTQSR